MGYLFGSERATDHVFMPYGKYANQPVSLLQHDIQYARWLLSTEYFTGRYAALAHIVEDIVKQQEQRHRACEQDKADALHDHAAEIHLLLSKARDAGPELCVAFRRPQHWLDDAGASQQGRIEWIEALLAVALKAKDDKRLMQAYLAVEPLLRRVRDFPALLMAQLAAIARDARGAEVIDLRTREPVAARPAAPKKRA
jgi:hypothetical protein